MGENSNSNTDTADVVITGNDTAKSIFASQTAVFEDSENMQKVAFNSPDTPVAINDRQASIDLNNFLKRPTLISTLTWSGSLNATLLPWHLFFSNTYIQSKVKNFGLFRGNLHVRYEMSAAPTVYGAAYVGYVPLHDHLSTSMQNASAYMATATQRPGFWLLPQESSGGEIVLPFFWKSNYVNLQDEDTLKELGSLICYSWVGTDTSNDVAVPALSIQVYAWCDDAMLEGPTAQLIMQSGESEYSSGPIERIASAVATVANAISVVPVIRPFALATEIGARAMGSVAALFGWSKVPVIENSQPVTFDPFHGVASSTISGPIQKLTLDPKAEISVDPRIVNLSGRDELNINYLTSKWSTLTTKTWAASDVPQTELLILPVDPLIRSITTSGSIGTTVVTIHTPLSYFTSMFSKWRGDIIFKFKVIASKYHRGKLKISFDPFGNRGAADYTNVIFTQIIDITNDTEIEFTVPYMQESTWSSVGTNLLESWNFSTGGGIDFVPGQNNGVLSLQVLTPLSSPQAAPTCTILASIRGGPNFEVAVPRDFGQYRTPLTLQSGEVTVGKQHPQEYLVNFGENITSLRQVMSRSTFSQRFYPNADATLDAPGIADSLLVLSRFPHPKGYDLNAPLLAESLVTASTNKFYTFSEFHPINYVSACFAGVRGSIQDMYVIGDPANLLIDAAVQKSNLTRIIQSAKLEGEITKYVRTSYDQQNSVQGDYQYNLSLRGEEGMALTKTPTGGVLHIETPSRTRHLFNSTRQEDWLRGTTWDDSDTDSVALELSYATGDELSQLIRVDRYMNIGTDFNLHFFVGVPIVRANTVLGKPKYEE